MIDAFHALMTWGAPNGDAVSLVLRLGVGLPFLVSGLDKLICPICHGWLVANLTKSGIPWPRYTCWWVAGWEAVAGLLLVLGLFTGFAALVLLIICIVAWIVSWRRKVLGKNPAHIFDAFTEVGFMFDTLLVWMLMALFFTGPGFYSLDQLLWESLR